MSIKGSLGRANVPTQRVHAELGNGSLVVNSRNLGSRGQLSGDFGRSSAATTSRNKMQLRHLMAKQQSAAVADNPIQKRRMQQKIATKAGELYGVDPKKLMDGGSKTVDSSRYSSGKTSSSHYEQGGGLATPSGEAGISPAPTSSAPPPAFAANASVDSVSQARLSVPPSPSTPSQRSTGFTSGFGASFNTDNAAADRYNLREKMKTR